ncbi:MAG: hypothetical protein ACI9HK_001100, partial [Pirellulaceae bacterium]
ERISGGNIWREYLGSNPVKRNVVYACDFKVVSLVLLAIDSFRHLLYCLHPPGNKSQHCG